MSIEVFIKTEDPSRVNRMRITAGFMDTFVDSLANLDKPKHCACYYLSCMHIFNTEPPVYAELRCVRPDIFAAILRFLTIRRLDSAILALEKRLSTCQCAETYGQPTFDSTHILDAPPIGEAFPHLVERAVSFVSLAFLETGRIENQWPSLDQARKEARKAEQRGESLPWPKQPSDVFVNPPEMMLQSLWKLYHAYEEQKIVIFIHLLMLSAGTTFTSVISTVPDFPRQFMYHFERVLALPDSAQSRLLFTMVLHILVCVRNRFFEGDMHLITAWQPHAADMVMSVSKAIYIYDALPGSMVSDGPQTPTKKLLATCGHVLILMAREDPKIQANIHRYHPMIITESRLFSSSKQIPDQNLVVAYDKIYRLVTSDRCHAPGCFETFSKQSRRFQACSGCKVVSYCSKECQALAWKHPDVPHKPFCAALVSYTKKIGVDWRKTAIRPQVDPEGVAKLCSAGGVTREESRRILNFDLDLINWNSWFKTMGEVNGPEFRRLMATKRHM